MNPARFTPIRGFAAMFAATRHSAIPRLVLCGAVLAGLLLALLMAVSPELHDTLHHDSGGPEHVCLATVLAGNGCDDVASAPVLAGFVAMLCEPVETMRSQRSGSSFLSGCVLEHAPPFIS